MIQLLLIFLFIFLIVQSYEKPNTNSNNKSEQPNKSETYTEPEQPNKSKPSSRHKQHNKSEPSRESKQPNDIEEDNFSNINESLTNNFTDNSNQNIVLLSYDNDYIQETFGIIKSKNPNSRVTIEDIRAFMGVDDLILNKENIKQYAISKWIYSNSDYSIDIYLKYVVDIINNHSTDNSTDHSNNFIEMKEKIDSILYNC
ncbi:hypothetical protein [Dasineura jujubifolia toursvirus 2a]|nr:hypothetical protein [Dasineura jujubifolia toursvirus 2a]